MLDEPMTMVKKVRPPGPCWMGEAWGKDDGLVLNLPLFAGCSREFKRQILRGIRVWEFEFRGKETWYDESLGQICTLDILEDDVLPPLQPDLVGAQLEPEEYICRGGDYDTRLVVVLEGTIDKFVGGIRVRTLVRGECEGLAEFLGVGIEQRTCTLRAGMDGARVRYVGREALRKVLAQTEKDNEEVFVWPQEKAYFAELALDRIDSLSHKDANRLLQWPPASKADAAAGAIGLAEAVIDAPSGGPSRVVLSEDISTMDINGPPIDYRKIPGQALFRIPSVLGTTTAGPLPEGIEERYYFNGQTVLKAGIVADSCLLILRGEVAATVPEGCQGQCLPRNPFPRDVIGSPRSGAMPQMTWLCGNKSKGKNNDPDDSGGFEVTHQEGGTVAHVEVDDDVAALLAEKNAARVNEVLMVALVEPKRIKKAQKALQEVAHAGHLDLTDQRTSDWRWPIEDPRSLTVVDTLDKAKLLSEKGQAKATEVRSIHDPPPPPPPPEPQARLGPGSIIGELSLVGVPVVLAGDVWANGPVVVAVLHRHVVYEAVAAIAELEFFVPRGITMKEKVRTLAQPMASSTEAVVTERPDHLGPITGPPAHVAVVTEDSSSSAIAPIGLPAADSMEYVLLNSIRKCNFLWDLIHDAPPRLLEALIREFEPRWLLANEVVVVDEEPEADFLFIVIHGTFVVTLEGAEIDRVGQGAVMGFAQILGLNDWTRTVTADPFQRGEAMIQVLRRDSLVKVLAGHPVPKGNMRDIQETLRDAKSVDWRIIQPIPAFGNAAGKPFLQRILKDADVRLFCPGDFLAKLGEVGGSMYVVIAGECRSEQPQTLFFVSLKRGDWCFQNNILGVEADRAHDVVAVTHCMVLVLYRHALLNALVAYPEARDGVLENEVWRTDPMCPQLAGLNVFEGVPGSVIARLEREAKPLYYRAGASILVPGDTAPDDALLFIVRGKARISIMGMEVRILNTGDTIGMHRFLLLPCGPSVADIVAVEPCDILSVQRSTIEVALQDDRIEEAMSKFRQAASVLGGGAILDAFGFPVGGVEARLATDCIETSEVFRVCSESFVAQIPTLLEERAYWPGERLYEQFGDGEFMFFIQAGRVRLQVLGRKEDEIVNAGSTLGDMACLGQVSNHVETAVAETHVWARGLHRRLLQRALMSFPEEERRLTGAAQEKGAGGLFDDE
jgi:CRP-like cAMP-binding protein